jgi:hypothetical protein
MVLRNKRTKKRAVLHHGTCNWNSGGKTVIELWDEMEEGDEEKDKEKEGKIK